MPEVIEEIKSLAKEAGEKIQQIQTDQKAGNDKIKSLEAANSELQKTLDEYKKHIDALRKTVLERRALSVRPKGKVSDDCAEAMGAKFILHLKRKGGLESVVTDEGLRKKLLDESAKFFGFETTEKALATTDIPLPTNYYGQIEELIAEYGVVRGAMMNWPLSGGTDKPPRSKTGFEFGSIAMSAQFTEKTPQIEFASLESHKIGGIIYTPREIREQSIVALGQYLAKMAATRFAWAEDKWGFLADGTATYESVSGVCKICADNSQIVTLAATKTSPNDIATKDLRAAMAKVNTRARAKGVWYLNNTWETKLPDLNTQANQYVFRYRPDGVALLYGRPVVWTEVLQIWTEDAAAGTYAAVFGDLSWWWFGKRSGGPRIDESEHLKFDYDQIATRFIEEIDFDYMALASAAVIKTAAA